MRYSGAAAVCAVAVAVLSTAASAATVIVPLPGLLSYTGGNKVVSFDAGVQFQSISQVRIHLEGSVTPGVLNYYDPATQTSGTTAVPTHFGPGLGPDFNLQAMATTGNPVNGTFPFEFWPPYSDYDFLLGGKSKVNMTLFYMFDGHLTWTSWVSAGSATITAASLEIDGQVVPEPATLATLAFGGLLLTRRRQR